MGLFSSSSSSKTSRTYNTTNTSQQGEGANVSGDRNRVTVQRADAMTLDNIAKMHGEGFADLLREQGDGLDSLIDEVGATREDSLMFTGQVFTEALEQINSRAEGVQELAKQTTANLMQNSQTTADAIQTANTSETARLSQSFALGALVLVGFIAWSNAR